MTASLLSLTQELLRARDVRASLDIIARVLNAEGFDVDLMVFGPTPNLVARRAGDAGRPALLFLGHADVVPAGLTEGGWREEGWSHDPFSGDCEGGRLHGRGAVDMKGSIACFLAALGSESSALPLSLLISGDEEGSGVNGTPAVLDALQQRGSLPSWDFVLIGEPTSTERLGDHVKIGCRGSVNVTVTVQGQGGHVAYPQTLVSPVTALVEFLERLDHDPFEEEDPLFGRTHVETTSILADSGACNVVPAVAKAAFNVRFTPGMTPEELMTRIKAWAPSTPGVSWLWDFDWQSYPFASPASPYLNVLTQSVKATMGKMPRVSALGASSDARFLPRDLPFAEFGLFVQEAHKVNESVQVDDLERLRDIYSFFLRSLGDVRK